MNNKFFFLIENIDCDFSAYGNDVTWSGRIVDAGNQTANDYLSIQTCETVSDPWEYISENDENNEIINEDGDIIDHKRYDEEEAAYYEIIKEWYWEIDCDYSETVEIDGKSYTKIPLKDFVANHQIGQVGNFDREKIDTDLDSVEDINDFAERKHVEIGDWNTKFVLVYEFEEDENQGDSITGWLTMNTGDVFCTTFICNNYIDGHGAINKMCDDELSLDYLIQHCGFSRENITGCTDLYIANICSL